jgi:hypothetical protein
MDPLVFLPAHDNWRQILRLPSNTKIYWANALLIEIEELIKKVNFDHDNPSRDDPIIPVISKYRVKLIPDGSKAKLKARILMKDIVVIPDTWCPTAGFRSLKISSPWQHGSNNEFINSITLQRYYKETS